MLGLRSRLCHSLCSILYTHIYSKYIEQVVERISGDIGGHELKDDMFLPDVKQFTHFVRSITFGGELIASITVEKSVDLNR